MTSTCDFCGKEITCPMFYDGKMCCSDCWATIRSRLQAEQNTMKREDTTTKVSYNGFTGELVKLVRMGAYANTDQFYYELAIYDKEKQAQIIFTGVKLKDVKFLGGAVSFEW